MALSTPTTAGVLTDLKKGYDDFNRMNKLAIGPPLRQCRKPRLSPAELVLAFLERLA